MSSYLRGLYMTYATACGAMPMVDARQERVRCGRVRSQRGCVVQAHVSPWHYPTW
jgi:hypothetical protein